MKIRTGFVSNSSSTSFTFLLNGGKLDLFDMIRKYKKYFQLKDSFGGDTSINYEDVIQALDKVLDYDEDGMIESIDRHIIDELATIDYWEESIKEDRFHQEWMEEALRESRKKLEILQDAKRHGLVDVITVGFGDNDGDICGDDVGRIMDYTGRKIKINQKDFVVFTRQNR